MQNLTYLNLWILGKLPDPAKSKNHLSAFAKLKDTHVYKLIRDCMNPQSDYKTVRKSAVNICFSFFFFKKKKKKKKNLFIRKMCLNALNK